MGVDRIADAGAEPYGQAAQDGPSRDSQRDFIYGLLGWRVTTSAERLSAVLDGAEILLALA